MPDLENLDHLLRAWADDQRLTPEDAEEIRRFVVTQPMGLPATWWQDFGTQMGAVITKAAQASSPAFGIPTPALVLGT